MFFDRDDPRVLWLFYEDLIEDRAAVIERIAGQCIIFCRFFVTLCTCADFLDIKLTPELKDIVMLQSSFEFMKVPLHDDVMNIFVLKLYVFVEQENGSKYDDHFVSALIYEVITMTSVLLQLLNHCKCRMGIAEDVQVTAMLVLSGVSYM